MKIKNNVKHFNVIYVLVVFLLFALMPITISSTAEGEYQISDEQTLKNWLQDSGSVQTNNPNAVLTTDITLNWGGVAPDGVGQGSSAVNSGSTLDGQGHNIIIQGGSNVIGDNGRSGGSLRHDSNPYYVGMFVQYIYGTIKNINFSLNSDKTITIDYYKNKNNEQIFTGMIAGSIENGRVENCSLTIDKNITYNERNAYNDINDDEIAGSGSNHAGGVAGRIVGSTVIKNVRIVQNAGTTITIHTNHSSENYDRWAFIASDSYRDGSGNVPQIINVQIERYGNLVIRDNSDLTEGNYLYGIVIADMSTSSDNDANHAVHINGVIYNGVADVAWGANDQIDFGNYDGPDGFSYNYFTGRYPNGSTIHNEPDRFSIQNVYSYVTLTSESSLQNEVGVSLIPSGYTASFNENSEGQMIFTKNNAGTNDFIYSISQTESATTFNTYLQLSSSVTLDKFNTAASVGMDTISILDGTKVDNASFGFQYEEVTYNGLAHTAIFEVNEQIITEGFSVKYENNINSTVTNNGALATCTFEHPDTPDGIFLHSTRQYVANEAIDLTYYQEMTILQAPLSLTYTGSNIYDNNLAISGLVNNEQLIINGTKYSNGNFNFDCTNNVTNKVISFTDGIIKTNYNISYSGISDDTFVVNPKVIAVDEGITITNAQDQTIANFADNVLTIYSKSYNTIELTFAQEEGYLNRAIFNTNNGTTYNIVSSLEGTTMSYVVSPQNENDFAFIEDLTLDVSLTRVALRFEINDKSLISSLKVNGEDVYKFGNYFAFDCDYNEMATITVTAAEGDYTIEFLVNDMPASSSDGTLTVNAKGDANNMMYIKINITAA